MTRDRGQGIAMRRYRVVLIEFQNRVSLRPPSLLEQAGLWAWLGAALEHHNRLLNSGWAGGFEGRRTEIQTSPELTPATCLLCEK